MEIDLMWKEIIRDLGVFGLGSGALAWALKSIVTHWLTTGLEAKKVELKLSADTTLEQTKASLQANNQERIMVQTQLHTKKAEIIARIYSRLCDHRSAAEMLASPFGGDAVKEEQRHQEIKAYTEMRDYFRKHKIYLKKDLCVKLDEIMKKIDEIIKPFHIGKIIKDQGGDVRKYFDAWIEASPRLNAEIDPMLELIEDEFREVLGVIVKVS